jgi:hypothetical protein
MRLEFLLAYSPDFNPIELAFSVIKAYIRRHYRHFARSHTTGTNPVDEAEVHIMLNEAIYSLMSQKNSLVIAVTCNFFGINKMSSILL